MNWELGNRSPAMAQYLLSVSQDPIAYTALAGNWPTSLQAVVCAAKYAQPISVLKDKGEARHTDELISLSLHGGKTIHSNKVAQQDAVFEKGRGSVNAQSIEPYLENYMRCYRTVNCQCRELQALR